METNLALQWHKVEPTTHWMCTEDVFIGSEGAPKTTVLRNLRTICAHTVVMFHDASVGLITEEFRWHCNQVLDHKKERKTWTLHARFVNM